MKQGVTIPPAWDPTRLIAPGGCLVCGDPQTPALCAPCLLALEDLSDRGCRRCGNPDVGDHAVTCAWCTRLTHLPDQVCTCFAYRQTGRTLYHQVKYRGYHRLLRPLAATMQQAFFKRMDYPYAQCLIPVPETLGRKLTRDFNPPTRIAQELSRFTGLPVVHGVKVRPFSRRQVGLDDEQRRKNARKRYRLSGTLPESVILVDDVVTTGATLEAMTGLLRRSGVQRVGWFSLFRTP